MPNLESRAINVHPSNAVGYGVHFLAKALVPFRIPPGSEFAKTSSFLKGLDGGQIYSDGLVHRLANSLPGEASPGFERPVGILVEIAADSDEVSHPVRAKGAT